MIASILIGAAFPAVMTAYPGIGNRQLIVKFVPGIDVESRPITMLIRRAGGKILSHNVLLGAVLVDARNPSLLRARLESTSEVEFVEDNIEMRLIDPQSTMQLPPLFEPDCINPNDAYYDDEQWNLKIIRMWKAWERSMGCPSIIVAIVDTGIDYEHDDLWENYLLGNA